MSNVASLSSTNPQLAHAVGIKLLKTAMNVTKSQGDAAVSLIQAAAEVQQKSFSQPGKGARLDTVG